MLNWFIASVIALAVYTLSDTLVKEPSEELGAVRTLIWLGLFSTLAFLAVLPITGVGTVNIAVVGYSLIIAACMGIGGLLIFNALKTEQVSNVMVLTELSYVVVVLYGGLALNENVSMQQWITIAVVLLGTFLVSTTERFKFNKAFALVIVGQLLWGVWYIPFSYATKAGATFAVPIILGLVISSMFFLGYYLLRRRRATGARRHRITPRLASVVVLVGVTYGIGLIFFGYLVTTNLVAAGAAIIATEPAFVMLLGRLFYNDRFAMHQIFGFALMISGAVVLSILA